MITIWKTPIVATVEQVLKDLKLQLYGAGLLKEIKNTGSDLMCTCPFHANGKEHNPSCGVLLQQKVTKDKTYEAGTVHCYTCGYTADLPQFVADLLGLSSPVEGFKWLVNQYNYQTEERELPDLDMYRGSTAKSSVLEESLVKQYTQNLLQSEEACRYLHKRRIANWVLEAYELGFDPEDKTVLFPVRGMDGKVIFYKGRSIAGKHFYNAKEVDKTSVVFGLWEILNGSFSWGTSDQIEEVWITESEIDALSLISYGVPAVAIMGSHISEDQCKELERTPFRRFVLATDNDDAGRKGASQIKRVLIPKGFRFINLKWHTSLKDINELNELTGSVRGAENYEKWREAEAKKQNEKHKALNVPEKKDKDIVPEVDPKGEVFTGELGRSIRKSFDGGDGIVYRGFTPEWGDYEEKKLQALYSQRELLTDTAQLKQINTIIKNHEEYKKMLNTKGVLVEVGKSGTYKLAIPPSLSVDERVRERYKGYNLVEFQYTKYNYDVYEERLGGKYYITMKGISSKKEKQEIYSIADKVFTQNTRAVGAKLRIDNVECNKHNTRTTTNLGFYTPSQHKLTVRTFKSYADIYSTDLQGGKEYFAGTLAHEFAHVIHSTDLRLKDVTATATQWQAWKELVDPYYTQYRENKLVDMRKEWHRMDYPVNAEDYYRGGGKEHFYQELWAESTAVIQEDVPKETKEKQIANLKKYFPKVAEFILAFYGGGV